jgi:diguanylate cyclase (GGDEF)-like protein
VGLAQSDTDTGGEYVLEDVLEQLAELKQTPVGTVIHEQVTHILDEHQELSARLDQTYGLLLHLLLDAYARDPNPEHVTRVNAQLIRVRAGEGTADLSEPMLPEMPAEAAVRPPAPETQRLWAPPPTPESVAPAATESRPRAPESAPTDMTPAPAANERRVNSAYRLHLDRKRSEIERLQETLSRSVGEAVTQNREFGALLQIELRALQQAEGAQEVEHLRTILIDGIEELLRGQNQLGNKLHRTSDYLKLMTSDGQRLREELDKVRLLSLTDEFTGLPNRRAFMRRLQDEISRAQRFGTPLAMALIDLDEFKAVNDTFGHAAGDEVLRCYANQVLSILRHHDMVARYGGEEFAVLLPNTSEHGAVRALSKVRARTQEVPCAHEGKTLPLPSFSGGVTLYVPGEAPNVFIDRADRALYRAKANGRNRVEVAVTPTHESEITNGNER